MQRFLVLQHIACEPPAAFEDELLAWGASVQVRGAAQVCWVTLMGRK